MNYNIFKASTRIPNHKFSSMKAYSSINPYSYPLSTTTTFTNSVLTMFLCVGRSSSDEPTARRPLYTAGRGWVKEKKGAEWVEERGRDAPLRHNSSPLRLSMLQGMGDSVKGPRGCDAVA